MYLIIDNKPYALRDNKVYEVKFGDRGTIAIGEEVDKEVKGKTYTYDEIYRKFNLRSLLQSKNEPTKDLVDELNKKIETLTKENASLKKQLEGLNKKEEQVVEEVVEEVEVKETNKKNK